MLSNAWISILLVGCLCVASGYAGGYSIISPKSIRQGQDYKLTVSISGASGVNVAASLTNAKGTKFPNAEKTVSNIGNGESKEITITNVPTDLKVNDIKLKVVLTGGLSVTNSTALDLDTKSLSIFIQTDKAKYKPLDTLQVRVFATNSNLMPVLKTMVITVKSPKNDMYQLRTAGKADKNGVISFDYIIPQFADLGEWSIDVKIGDDGTVKKFKVEKYVLPRFEVKIETQPYALLGTKVPIVVKVLYTFGGTVPGTVELTVKQQQYEHSSWWSRNLKDKEEKFTLKLVDGKGTVVVQIGKLNVAVVKVFAEMTELFTNDKLNNTVDLKVYARDFKLEKRDFTSTYFTPGLKYYAFLKLEQPDGSPITRDIKVAATYTPCAKTKWGHDCYSNSLTKYVLPEKTVSKGGDGQATFEFTTDTNVGQYLITAQADGMKDNPVNYRISKFEARNAGAGLQLLLKSDIDNVKVGTMISFSLSSKNTFTAFSLLVLSKGSIVYEKGFQTSSVATYSFDVMLTNEMAPSAKFFVSSIRGSGTDTEVVADYLELAVEGSMQNKVSVKFNKPQAELGEDVSVIVNGAPKSYVGVLCVDKSVILLATGNDITQDDVIEEQRSYGVQKNKNSGMVMPFFCRCGAMPSRAGSTRQMLGDLNLAIMTGAIVAGFYTPYRGGGGGGIMVDAEIIRFKGPVSADRQPKPSDPEPEPRTEFPETWIWLDKIAGANGRADFKAKVPDTITTWECSAFSLDMKKGLGVAPNRAKLIAKKEFFLKLILPYSIKNGENFILKVLVHQYTGKELKDVRVVLHESDQFNANGDVSAKSKHVFKKQAVTKFIKTMTETTAYVAFEIQSKRIGKIKINVDARVGNLADKIIKDLRVEPSGVKREVTIPKLVTLKSGTPYETSVDIKVPSKGVVPGSVYVEVATTGDIMGPTLSNLDDLLQMPTGCGEQNMINFAPAMFIYRYLQATNKMSGEIKAKALKIMNTGHTRELTFQVPSEGCFSAFGQSPGSTWLTAFVVKSFAQAAQYITISESGLYKAVDCLLSRQEADGKFKEPGKVIHDDFLGGSGKGMGLYAYVLIAMQEYPQGFKNRQKIIKDKAALTSTLLENHAKSIMNKISSRKPTDKELYDLAIIAYALALGGNSYADTILAKLDTLAKIDNGEKYWKMSSPATCTTPYRCYSRKPNPSEVELASYALLAYIKRGKCATDAGCGYIVKWMSGKQTKRGAFCSTKDTVLGIQAMSKYAQEQTAVAPNLNVDFTYGRQKASFSVTKDDSTLMNEKLFYYQPNVKVKAKATGSGTAIIGVNYWYNEDEITQYTNKIDVKPEIKCSAPKNGDEVCDMRVCVSQKDNLIKGMSLVEANCLSGFEPYGPVVCDKCTKMTLNRYEAKDTMFVAYLNDVSSKTECLKMKCIQKNVVTKYKPSVIRVSDYYNTDVQMEVTYNAPSSLLGEDACKLCGEPCGCPKSPVGSTGVVTTTPVILFTIAMALFGWMLN